MKQKKYLILFILWALIMSSCSSPTPAPTSTPTPPEPTAMPTQPPLDDSWQKVQQAGVLRVGTSADYPPFEYRDQNNEIAGFDVALIQQIGQKLGVKVEITDFAFDGLPMAVANGQVDVVISALSVTPERQAIANFSNVYYASTDAVLSRPEADPKNLQNPEALAASRLGVQLDSIYETYAQEKLVNAGLMPKQNLFVYIDIAQAVDALKVKQIDAVWMDLIPAQQYVDETSVKILVQDLNQQLYAIGMMKGADTLVGKINEALTQLQNDGTLANLTVQYLGVNPEDVVVPPTLTPTSPQPTQKPAQCLDNAELVKVLSYDDKNMQAPPVLNPSQPFTKGWRMRNSGTCTWKSGYRMVYSYGNVPAAQMNGKPIQVTKDVKPGNTVDLWVDLIAPIVPGRYQGYWNMRNSQNFMFGETAWVDIVVSGGATPTPPPTPTPEPSIIFKAEPTTITAGEAVQFWWTTENVKTVYFYHDGQNWWEHPVPDNFQATEYPPYTMSYHLHVIKSDDTEIDRPILITVNPAPDDAPYVEYLTPTPAQITLGESVGLDWKISGPVHQAQLYVDGNAVLDPAPVQGHYVDTPQTDGTHIYKLIATGPGGEDVEQVSVNVQTPATETVEPVEPTETPEPLEPTLGPQPEEPTLAPPPEEPTQAPPPEEPTLEPPPEEPTPMPEPPTPPAPEPPAIYGFEVSPNTIEQGQSVTASWTTGGGTTYVELLRNGEVIWTDTQLNNSVPYSPPDGPGSTIKFTLIAYNNAGATDTREATVQVVEATPTSLFANSIIVFFNWKPQLHACLPNL